MFLIGLIRLICLNITKTKNIHDSYPYLFNFRSKHDFTFICSDGRTTARKASLFKCSTYFRKHFLSKSGQIGQEMNVDAPVKAVNLVGRLRFFHKTTETFDGLGASRIFPFSSSFPLQFFAFSCMKVSPVHETLILVSFLYCLPLDMFSNGKVSNAKLLWFSFFSISSPTAFD